MTVDLSCFKCWVAVLGFEILGAFLFHILASMFRWFWYHLKRDASAYPPPLLIDWSEALIFAVYLVVQAGIVLSSLGVISQQVGLAINEWSWQIIVVAWLFYLSVSIFISWLALNLLSTHKQERSLKNTRRRNSFFLLSVFAKIGVFLFASGWTMLNPTASALSVIPISYFIAIGIDAIAFILIMLVD